MNLLEILLAAAIWSFVIVLAVSLYRRFKRLERRVENLERRRHKGADGDGETDGDGDAEGPMGEPD